MSIFDPTSGMNPLPWLQEKTLSALKESARLVDLASEKDTAPWYANELKRRAGALITRLAPVVSICHAAGEEAAQMAAWTPIIERGTFALAAWCKKYDIQDPTTRAFDMLAQERSVEEIDAKAERSPVGCEEENGDDLRILGLRCTLYASLTRRLLHEELPEPARRMLLWALSHLYAAENADTVSLSKRFLPTDINVTEEEARDAYRLLHERGFIERVDKPGTGSDQLLLRLIVQGVNDNKQPPAFREETFGYPGARIGGKPTQGSVLRIGLPAASGKALSRWKLDESDRCALELALQEHVGADRIFVEGTEISADDPPQLKVKLRYRWDENEESITDAVREAALAWVRARVVRADE